MVQPCDGCAHKLRNPRRHRQWHEICTLLCAPH
jgi:hypothetical protein